MTCFPVKLSGLKGTWKTIHNPEAVQPCATCSSCMLVFQYVLLGFVLLGFVLLYLVMLGFALMGWDVCVASWPSHLVPPGGLQQVSRVS